MRDLSSRPARPGDACTGQKSAPQEIRRSVQIIRRLLLTAIPAVLLMPCLAWAAEVRGKVTLADGRPAANEPIALAGREIGRTDVTGVYTLNLPPGTHRLVVKGQEVSVWVSPHGNRQDIQLR